METPGPTSGTPPVKSTTATTAAVRWQVGQLLQATVLESNVGKVLLAIGNRQVSSETSLLLDKGQQLTVQVRSLGDTPVLRIASDLNMPALARAIRALLPQQDAMTPLLASLARLAQTPRPPVPPLIRELTHAMVRNLPDTTAVMRPEGLRRAIEQSGLFLERRLAQQINPTATPTSNPTPVSAIQSDFKANLLQLIQRLQNWPGSSPPPSPSGSAKSSTLTAPASGQAPPAPMALTGSSQATIPVRAGDPGAGIGNVAANSPQTIPVTPDQLRRAVQSGAQTPVADTRSPAATTLSPTTTTATPTTGTVPAALPGTAPPPFPGATPAPQAAVQATIDLVNRIGNLHTDLLRQAEVALARIQLHQLASQPRDAERGLLEWLLELPVRRGDDIDLWSMRIAREGKENATPEHQRQQSWSVQLAFDLPGLGPVQAQITLTGERVSTRFWTGKEDTLPLFREHLQDLQHMLGNVGLEVESLDCVPGPMPTNTAAPSLIREKA